MKMLGYNGYLVVEQTEAGIRLVSKHKKREKADKVIAGLRKGEGLFAIVQSTFTHASPEYYSNYYKHPSHSTKPGAIIPADCIDWRGSAGWRETGRPCGMDCCSECCDNCMPDSLTYKCPLTRDHPLCGCVEAILKR